MTLEKASEIVNELVGENKRELFTHFVGFFNLKESDSVLDFAKMCGFVA